MDKAKKDIIAGLRSELLAIQGLGRGMRSIQTDEALGPMKKAFPNQAFPVSAVHEFISDMPNAATTAGFISVLVSTLMKKKDTVLWISTTHSLFPPALLCVGLDPDKVIFIYVKNDKEASWAMEEALKCPGLAAVVGEVKEISFTTSRRLQLAVEKSHVTAFILRCNPKQVQTTACLSRWKIKPLRSELPGKMPGVGFPRWEVELLKIRNGHPGKWQIEFRGGRLRFLTTSVAISLAQKKKAV